MSRHAGKLATHRDQINLDLGGPPAIASHILANRAKSQNIAKLIFVQLIRNSTGVLDYFLHH